MYYARNRLRQSCSYRVICPPLKKLLLWHRGINEDAFYDLASYLIYLICAMLCCSVMSNSLPPHGLQPARLLCLLRLLWGFSRQEYWNELLCLPPGDLPNPGIKSVFPTLQADALPSEPPGKPKKSGMGSLSLLQGTFLTQESNQGLLHCRKILYQLSYQGSPYLI